MKRYVSLMLAVVFLLVVGIALYVVFPTAKHSVSLSSLSHFISRVSHRSQLASSLDSDPALVGWWKMDETSGTSVSDSSGNGNTGTFDFSAYEPSWISGRIGGALHNNQTGGGAYASVSNVTLTAGNTVDIAVGAGGATAGGTGGDTYLCNSTSNCTNISGSAVQVGAKGGSIGIGGSSSSSVGTTKYSGGGTNASVEYNGGGGSAGPHGNGGNGGKGRASGAQGGGGGGGGGGTDGASVINYGDSSAGGNNYLGTGGGTSPGDNGSNGGGGAGIFEGYVFTVGSGGNGQDWDSTHGSGGGGGGGSYDYDGGSPGLYGAGAGAGGLGGTGDGKAGAQGIIVITYTTSGGGSINTSGLVGYWPFDGKYMNWTSGTAGTALDASGNGYSGTLTGMNRTTNVKVGKIGQALTFNGSSQDVNAGQPADIHALNTFSVSFWVYPTSGGTIVSHDQNNPYDWAIFYDSSNQQAYIFVAYTSSSQYGYTPIGSVPLNTWTHVVFTWDGNGSSDPNAIQSYINGSAVTTVQSGGVGTHIQDNTTLYFGVQCPACGSPLWWSGSLDEVRIYNRVLSTKEVKQLYTMGK